MITAKQLAAKKKPRKVKWGRTSLNCKILHFRSGLGLSVRDVAKGAGLHASLISRAEHNFDLTMSSALKIARFFERPVEEIWSEL